MTKAYNQQIQQKNVQPDLSSHQKAVFILHDQLNLEAWPDWIQNEKPLLIFIESKQKSESLPYHKQKLTYMLSSMRHFAIECANDGFDVLYHSTKDHYDDGLREVLNDFKGELTFMTPSEWDTRERMKSLKEDFKTRVNEIPNTFFLADAEEWKEKIGPNYRMEFFYREMRKQTGYLMNGDEPEGGDWNYDEKNRESLPKDYPLPEFPVFEPNEITLEVMNLVNETFENHFGELNKFEYAVTRTQALSLLDDFIKNRLDEFGPYEDALKTGNHKIFHSQLSIYLNNGLLLPEEVCEKTLNAYQDGEARLNSVEGFIRQIIGWREFIRIYYEAMMPDVRNANHFGFTKMLPSLYWTGESDMKCMKESLRPVIEEGYSHHIQRLMVLSNFSNLTETDPRELNRWFWFAYVDAYEWVELPNVLGMSTYADGGILASKPYVSSGNYINKMSDYCKHCEYSVTQKTGEKACPFNYLYWNFVDKQRETFNDSGRVNFMVNMFDNRKSEQEKQEIRQSSENFLQMLKREA